MEQQAPPGLALNSVSGEYNYENLAAWMRFLIKNESRPRAQR